MPLNKETKPNQGVEYLKRLAIFSVNDNNVQESGVNVQKKK